MGIRASSVIVLVAVACGSGCGSSTPPPNDQYAASEADVGRAQAGGALDVPDAKLHLQLAVEDLQKSKQLFGQDNDRAARLAAVASAEAQLALSIARANAARDQAHVGETELQKTVQH